MPVWKTSNAWTRAERSAHMPPFEIRHLNFMSDTLAIARQECELVGLDTRALDVAMRTFCERLALAKERFKPELFEANYRTNDD